MRVWSVASRACHTQTKRLSADTNSNGLRGTGASGSPRTARAPSVDHRSHSRSITSIVELRSAIASGVGQRREGSPNWRNVKCCAAIATQVRLPLRIPARGIPTEHTPRMRQQRTATVVVAIGVKQPMLNISGGIDPVRLRCRCGGRIRTCDFVVMSHAG